MYKEISVFNMKREIAKYALLTIMFFNINFFAWRKFLRSYWSHVWILKLGWEKCQSEHIFVFGLLNLVIDAESKFCDKKKFALHYDIRPVQKVPHRSIKFMFVFYEFFSARGFSDWKCVYASSFLLAQNCFSNLNNVLLTFL